MCVKININNAEQYRLLKITTAKNKFHFNGIIFSDRSFYVLHAGNPVLVSGSKIDDITSTVVDNKNQITFTVKAWDEVTIISNRHFESKFV